MEIRLLRAERPCLLDRKVRFCEGESALVRCVESRVGRCLFGRRRETLFCGIKMVFKAVLKSGDKRQIAAEGSGKRKGV